MDFKLKFRESSMRWIQLKFVENNRRSQKFIEVSLKPLFEAFLEILNLKLISNLMA
jgi:hypothetical protein